jgi:hypothetical protein
MHVGPQLVLCSERTSECSIKQLQSSLDRAGDYGAVTYDNDRPFSRNSAAKFRQVVQVGFS